MRYAVAVLMCLACFGCAGGKGLIAEIPEASFNRFEYNRAGNMTSAHITAVGSEVTATEVRIDEIRIQADYGPAVNFNVRLDGYRRARVVGE